MTTTVIHIKHTPARWNTNPQYVYIGRANPWRGLPQSKWANPYHIGKDGTREEVIEKYTQHIHDTGLATQVEELHDKILVCFCKPLACHGDVLIKLLEEKDN
jgi:hypothetical protein